MVEYMTFNHQNMGSNPIGLKKISLYLIKYVLYLLFFLFVMFFHIIVFNVKKQEKKSTKIINL